MELALAIATAFFVVVAAPILSLVAWMALGHILGGVIFEERTRYRRRR